MLSESLDQIMNIEHCLSMLVDLNLPEHTGSDTDSIKTEIFTDSEEENKAPDNTISKSEIKPK